MKKIIVMMLVLSFLAGCATSPPSLGITEAQVDAKINELLGRPVTSKGWQYDAENNRYVVDPSTARVVANDEVRLAIHEDNIAAREEWDAKHPPMTFWGHVKEIGITAIICLILGAVAGFSAK